MNDQTLKTAKAEALRFLARIEAFEKAFSTYQRSSDVFECVRPKQSGAIRRASMDLTRALADLRRSA